MELIPRAYQLSIYESIKQHGNTLVVLPTGLGKTLIALMLIQDRMKLGRCLFLTPTKPLAKQHQHSVMKTLELSDKNVALVTGEIAPAKRKEAYITDVIISTPQTIRNDLDNGVLQPDFSLVIFDESHRAVGDYAYTQIAEKLSSEKTLFVGLTASPGGRMDRIREVMDALRISNVEIRSHEDPDVAPYVQKSSVTWIPVELSDHFKEIKKELDSLTAKHAQKLAGMGFPPPLKHKGKFMELRQRILNIPHNIKYPALVQYSVLLHLLHMTELLETQGIYPMRSYLEKLGQKESKSAKMLLHEEGMAKVKLLCQKDEDHPKMAVLVETVKRLAGKKIIVFVQYRAQIARIEAVLKENGITARQFVGKKDGVTKKIQEETIADFREGKFDVMVASSIGEEGLDIPAVDAVIFYEPVPSEIRSIQRRGRAARLKEGEVIVLMTMGTRDEYHHYASTNREKRMKKILTGMQRSKKAGFQSADRLDKKEKQPESEKQTTKSEKNQNTESADPLAKEERTKKQKAPEPSPRQAGQTKMTDF
ncbi:DEAD/DEAH box helicase family protein [Candidatus Micrarchaeota archaeon]|nr:DEAD/DEAH box helicase family protein [Candidatus Micrarchaeota archaeon]